MTPPSPQHAAPLPLWRAMRAFLCLLFDLFGEPGDIAAQGVLGRRSRALLMPWLRAGEAFLRRLLFIEALALAPRLAVLKPRPRGPRRRRLFHFYPDKPEAWRVSFRLVPHRSRQRRGRGSRRRTQAQALPSAFAVARRQTSEFWLARALVNAGAVRAMASPVPRDNDNAWPLAERLEAMLRAYNAPQRPALRLARMLRRDEARALAALKPAPAHIAHLFGAQGFRRCDAIAASRLRKRDRKRRADSS